MKLSDFDFELPPDLVAQYPPPERGKSRLMVLDRFTGKRRHCTVSELPSLLCGPGFRAPGGEASLLVFNNSRVRKARLLGISESTGAAAEFLLLKKKDDFSWSVLSNKAKRRKPGSRYLFGGVTGTVTELSDGGGLVLRFEPAIDDEWLDINGHIPLPPYIKRGDDKADAERYQTVYAEMTGSSAAPTAGLHFTKELLREIESAGVETVFITLHVGLGTFMPVRTENIEDHRMHEETYSIDDESASRIERAKAEGKKIIAVGTTSVRTLESAWEENSGAGGLRRGEGSTSIFIYPGYKFRAVDAMFTNFHTPCSTLLMLVSAFAGRDFILESYAEAVKEGYRFFSYGDACLIK